MRFLIVRRRSSKGLVFVVYYALFAQMGMSMKVYLKTKREHSVLRKHPWVFSGAIERVEGNAAPGDIVSVHSSSGQLLGFGGYSPDSQIRIRMWSFGSEPFDVARLRDRIHACVGARRRLIESGRTNAVRLINAEADGVPGCVADRYGSFIVCSFTAAASESFKGEIVKALRSAVPECAGVYERSDSDVRLREGLEKRTGLLDGTEPPEKVEIFEDGSRFLVDVRSGHKTGFYLDQRDNRAAVRACAESAEMLNAFCYTGGFGIAALAGGVKSVTHIDLSEGALSVARENAGLNGGADRSEFICGNVFDVLRKFRDCGRSFDLIVLDPPKFASSKAALMKAARGYKDINLLGMKLLRPGGTLATFSCSELMTTELFRKVVQDAAADAGRDFQIVSHLRQAQDHPEGLFFPEGLYLKGLLCRAN